MAQDPGSGGTLTGSFSRSEEVIARCPTQVVDSEHLQQISLRERKVLVAVAEGAGKWASMPQ